LSEGFKSTFDQVI